MEMERQRTAVIQQLWTLSPCDMTKPCRLLADRICCCLSVESVRKPRKPSQVVFVLIEERRSDVGDEMKPNKMSACRTGASDDLWCVSTLLR